MGQNFPVFRASSFFCRIPTKRD